MKSFFNALFVACLPRCVWGLVPACKTDGKDNNKNYAALGVLTPKTAFNNTVSLKN